MWLSEDKWETVGITNVPFALGMVTKGTWEVQLALEWLWKTGVGEALPNIREGWGS